ncbi:hypothetical protein BCT94_05640 [Vibrio breoganii]|uniref:hypothetical protein n=1 Tax=Vibrio breoganii TaxID=553239 RepID=UPI000CB5897E|nr:hypothetical protein [Vibrio breoganii]PMK78568.1 hypothetical protein BCT94_05640 [Vibrio breoganii]
MANKFQSRKKQQKAKESSRVDTDTSVSPQPEQKKQSITTVKASLKTSYNVSPLTLRMSLTDKQEIAEWVDDLQEMTGRKVSPAKLFRALVESREIIDDAELIKLIEKMN